MFIVGVDLGQSQDYTAISVVERHVVGVPRASGGTVLQAWEYQYQLRYLERPPLGTRYTTVVQQVLALLARPPLDVHTPLVVDRTGCGAAVVDMFTVGGVRPRAITITGGDTASIDDPFDVRVPKRELAGTITVVYQNQRLKMAPGLALGETLIKEVVAFKPKINIATGNVSYEAWREHDHDDLVLSVAMAVWYGETFAMNPPQPFEYAASGTFQMPPGYLDETQPRNTAESPYIAINHWPKAPW